jgi:hypothetical protein
MSNETDRDALATYMMRVNLRWVTYWTIRDVYEIALKERLGHIYFTDSGVIVD